MEAPTPPEVGNQSSSPLTETAPEIIFEVNPQNAATAPPEFYPPSIPESSVPTPAAPPVAAEWEPTTPEPASGVAVPEYEAAAPEVEPAPQWEAAEPAPQTATAPQWQPQSAPGEYYSPVESSEPAAAASSLDAPLDSVSAAGESLTTNQTESARAEAGGDWATAAPAEWSDPTATSGEVGGYDYNNYYIDPTEYAIDVPPSPPESLTATAKEAPTAATTTPPTTATAPDLVPPPPPPPVVIPGASGGQAQPSPSPANPRRGDSRIAPTVRVDAPAPRYEAPPRYEAAAAPQRWVAAEPTVKLGPVQVSSNQVKFDMNKHAGILDYRRAARQRAAMGQGNTRMVFPLAVPTAITSVFGWRLHPISGRQQLHQGVDFGAPLGTPILAAFAGKVAIADWLGGYGLTVVLSHDEGTKETLYAHMSEVLVKEGQEVVQGEPIGLVGSTGFSTGPHLHFEVRELTPDGWVAMDPGTQIEYALAELLKSLQVAEAQPTNTANPAPTTPQTGAEEQGSRGAGEQGSFELPPGN
ncbi:MAG TPA: peptidoglycan DD-metalloendopeptidase family protein [Oscillatoriaceae cyanobacterium M33_DOE_052]|uniref:M23ase beta-sheet core domain-containing protein n=1 Tax=Planktothricoides sp. SpSt-374 TaxID=2282167 RepID=A0A7C3VI10_9CYAN|nr:peptidoglycan DD-metalloendopeptidase family protein [Oscillatoriaceae cyanobacterium M33_DOE_052]